MEEDEGGRVEGWKGVVCGSKGAKEMGSGWASGLEPQK